MWDDSSSRYDCQHAHGIQTDEEREAWTSLFREIVPDGSLDILDVGCGTGEMSMVLAAIGHTVCGVDLSDGMLAKAKEKATKRKIPVNFKIGDAESLPYDDRSFDLVINRHLLWTLPDPDKALSEWKRVLRPEGKVAVIDGLWRSNSYSDTLRRTVSNIGVFIRERRNLFKRYYAPEMIQFLPHPFGMDAETALLYIRNAGFDDTSIRPLKDIMSIQRKYMPLYRRISFSMPYYLISGKNSSQKPDT
jgi:ubiquinone/menaquinone biosynthesis C-methylase UbiE